jgi:short-subunit dehydrogenase
MNNSIFITGGTTGLGLEVARLYLEEGKRVGICGRSLSKLPEGILEKYPKLQAYQCDVLDRELLTNAINDFSKQGLDLVLANAGISVATKTDVPDFDNGRKVVEINVIGVLNTFEPAINIMLKNKSGHIAAISSCAGFIGFPGASFYSASKAAVITLCESYGTDLKKYGISVSCICPGFVKTPLTAKNKHNMPFLMNLDKGAQKIKSALERRQRLYIFPWQSKIAIIMLNKMPRFLCRWIMELPFLNYTK